jgi:hypothetical protein
VTALVGAAALLLLAAGALKVADPSAAATALAARGRPVPPAAVRAGGVAEAALGAAPRALGGRPLAVLVAVTYAAYALWVAAALRSGAPCGCFGEPDTPARPAALVVDVVLALAAAVGAVVGVQPLVGAGPLAVVTGVAVAVVAYVALAGRRALTR